MPSLIITLVSILATFTTAVIGLWKNLSIKKRKKETALLIGLAILFAIASVLLSINNYASSNDLNRKIVELKTANDYALKYQFGTDQPPVVNVQVLKSDTQLYVYCTIINNAKFPLKKARILLAGPDGNPDHTMGRTIQNFNDISPSDTADILFKIGPTIIFEIGFIVKWGEGKSIKCDAMGDFNGENINWRYVFKNPSIKLPIKAGSLKEFQNSGPSKKCLYLQAVLTERLFAVQAVIDSITVKDDALDIAVDERLRAMSAKAGGEKNLEKMLNRSIITYKEELRPDIKEQLILEKLGKRINSRQNITISSFGDSIPILKKLK